MPNQTSNKCTLDCEIPDPSNDWFDQSQLAEMLGVTPKTTSNWARLGRLARFEHRFPHCGRRKYSRTLVERALRRCWEQAVEMSNDPLEIASESNDGKETITENTEDLPDRPRSIRLGQAVRRQSIEDGG